MRYARINYKSHRTAAIVLALCALFSAAWSAGPQTAGMVDFRALYFGARCVVQHQDPYREAHFLALYKAESGQFPSEHTSLLDFLRVVPVCVNPPTTLFVVWPFTWLGWSLAHIVWLIFQSALLALAGFLVWEMSSSYAPRLSLVLIALLLANCELLLKLGNASASAVSLGILALWSFYRGHYEWAGVVALALSLALKPQISGVIWFFLLVVRPETRKRALQTLVLLALFVGGSVWWSYP